MNLLCLYLLGYFASFTFVCSLCSARPVSVTVTCAEVCVDLRKCVQYVWVGVCVHVERLDRAFSMFFIFVHHIV